MQARTGQFRSSAAALRAALALALAALLGACSSPPPTARPPATTGPGTSAAVNPGGTSHQAPPAERRRAFAEMAQAATKAHDATFGSALGVLAHLLGLLPPSQTPDVTNNWSGYQVLSARTQVAATQAAGTWVVPKVVNPSAGKTGFSAVWVGIGGTCLDASCTETDRSLTQLGTSEDVSPSGATGYFAWYEALPALSTPIRSLRVAPGDTVTASLAAESATTPAGSAPATQTWGLSMSVTPPGGTAQHWSTTVQYASSLASAEWIVEGPTVSCNGTFGEPPLADYHEVPFSNLEENGKAPSFGISNLVVGYDPYGQLSLPTPTSLMHGATRTYWVPFLAEGSAEQLGKATCNALEHG